MEDEHRADLIAPLFSAGFSDQRAGIQPTVH